MHKSTPQSPACVSREPFVSLLIAGLLTTLATSTTFTAIPTKAQTSPNGTTVYRCIDLQGIVNFSDAPCKNSVSKRMRIEHSLIQSVPISIDEQQRLNALESRLGNQRAAQRARTTAEKRRRHAEATAGAERCRQAQLGISQIRLRKRRGYPLDQSKRIDNEHRALTQEIESYCQN